MSEAPGIVELRKRMMKCVRAKVGKYCHDEYWQALFTTIINEQEDPLQYLEDNIAEYAIHAIATDYSYKNA